MTGSRLRLYGPGVCCSWNWEAGVSGEVSQVIRTEAEYGKRRAACDLENLRGKKLIEKAARRYNPTAGGLRTITALGILRNKVLRRLLANAGKLRCGRKSKDCTEIDEDCKTFSVNVASSLQKPGIAA